LHHSRSGLDADNNANTTCRENAVFSLSVVSDSYMLVILSGKGSAATYRAVVGFVGNLIEANGERRFLVDMLASEPALGAEEDREIGQLAGRLWKPAQVAIAVSRTDCMGGAVKAAREAGANVHTFSNLHDAGDWLKVGTKRP
jgi:hypothetical protein